MAKKKVVPLNSQEGIAHLSAGLGGIPIRYGSGPSVTAVPDRANDPKRTMGTSSNQEEINNMVSKIRTERKAKAAPGSPESRGSWTDRSGLH